LEEKSLDELGLGHVGEVGLGWGGLVHGLGLVDSNLGLNGLREGQGSVHLEVLRVTVGELLDGPGLLGLDQLVLNLGLRGSLEELGWSFVTAEEFLSDSLNLLDLLLVLGGLDEGLNGAFFGITVLEILDDLLGGLLFLNLLLLLDDLLDDLLALLTVGDASVGVLQQGDKLVLLLKVSVISLERHEESHADSESANESDEAHSLANVLLELIG
jgi:hypothetical protein